MFSKHYKEHYKEFAFKYCSLVYGKQRGKKKFSYRVNILTAKLCLLPNRNPRNWNCEKVHSLRWLSAISSLLDQLASSKFIKCHKSVDKGFSIWLGNRSTYEVRCQTLSHQSLKIFKTSKALCSFLPKCSRNVPSSLVD